MCCANLHQLVSCFISFINILIADPKACRRYWTNGYRKEDFAQDFYWEHSDEQIKFLLWSSVPRNDTNRNWVRLTRTPDDDHTSWGVDAGMPNGADNTCYICEIDLPIH